MPACVHGPSGVVPVVVRSALAFSPLDIELWQDNNVYVLALLMALMATMPACVHGPSGVVPVVVRSALTFSPLDIELWQDNNVYVFALLMALMLSDCCGRLRVEGSVCSVCVLECDDVTRRTCGRLVVSML